MHSLLILKRAVLFLKQIIMFRNTSPDLKKVRDNIAALKSEVERLELEKKEAYMGVKDFNSTDYVKVDGAIKRIKHIDSQIKKNKTFIRKEQSKL
jgi:hypothetical protein